MNSIVESLQPADCLQDDDSINCLTSGDKTEYNKADVRNIYEVEIPQLNTSHVKADRIDDEPLSQVEEINKIPKQNSVSDDIASGYFDVDLHISMRSQKQKLLGEEHFLLNVYTQNRAGFKTIRPQQWILALERYEEKYHEVNLKWFYKKDMNGKYCECDIITYFQTTTQVNIWVSLIRGILLIRGSGYEKWIQQEFPKLYAIFNEVNAKHVIIEDRNLATNIVRELDNKKDDQINIIQTTEKDVDTIWEGICENKNGSDIRDDPR